MWFVQSNYFSFFLRQIIAFVFFFPHFFLALFSVVELWFPATLLPSLYFTFPRIGFHCQALCMESPQPTKLAIFSACKEPGRKFHPTQFVIFLEKMQEKIVFGAERVGDLGHRFILIWCDPPMGHFQTLVGGWV